MKKIEPDWPRGKDDNGVFFEAFIAVVASPDGGKPHAIACPTRSQLAALFLLKQRKRIDENKIQRVKIYSNND